VAGAAEAAPLKAWQTFGEDRTGKYCCTFVHQAHLCLDEALEPKHNTDITYIRQEHLRQDLCDFLRRFDEIPPEMEKEIMEGPRRNVQVERDYRTYYDDKTIELIANVDKTFIEKFGYTFEE